MTMYSYCMSMYGYHDWGSSVLFLSCKANARVNPAKTGHGQHSSYFLCCFMYFCVVLCIVCFVSFSVFFVCICVLYYCHRVATQLQLNMSYHMNPKITFCWVHQNMFCPFPDPLDDGGKYSLRNATGCRRLSVTTMAVLCHPVTLQFGRPLLSTVVWMVNTV
jgi:hypothetical protein